MTNCMIGAKNKAGRFEKVISTFAFLSLDI
jgi:hypothetical protein